ncbi:hypothetical protein SEA_SIXAMA_35 [Gordonia phage Sixama]|uniref:Uncharacterized protein n=1 Tax=Gordonia phage Sixama TaxID=2653271 RepID=A0A5Q2F555_9CAUD|nr:hypothetical protein PP302_gp035 [Gordonia phage Sixama]QGF20214.1 hypothetical protein SEA_SIXAMA_35 [Gordonia phage Sixama]
MRTPEPYTFFEKCLDLLWSALFGMAIATGLAGNGPAAAVLVMLGLLVLFITDVEIVRRRVQESRERKEWERWMEEQQNG